MKKLWVVRLALAVLVFLGASILVDATIARPLSLLELTIVDAAIGALSGLVVTKLTS